MRERAAEKELLQSALDILDKREGSNEAKRFQDCIKAFERSVREEAKSSGFADTRRFFTRIAGKADHMKGEILRVMLAEESIFGRPIPIVKRDFSLYNALNDFATAQRGNAERLRSKYGSASLYDKLQGPPIWQLAVQLSYLYTDCCQRPNGEDFMTLFGFATEFADLKYPHATKGKTPRQSGLARDAYSTVRYIQRFNKKTAEIRARLRQRGIRSAERKRLKQELITLNEKVSKRRFRYPL